MKLHSRTGRWMCARICTCAWTACTWRINSFLRLEISIEILLRFVFCQWLLRSNERILSYWCREAPYGDEDNATENTWWVFVKFRTKQIKIPGRAEDAWRETEINKKLYRAHPSTVKARLSTVARQLSLWSHRAFVAPHQTILTPLQSTRAATHSVPRRTTTGRGGGVQRRRWRRWW